jgi:hypothetical protein
MDFSNHCPAAFRKIRHDRLAAHHCSFGSRLPPTHASVGIGTAMIRVGRAQILRIAYSQTGYGA